LNGEVNPSGHLPDTYAADFKLDPVWFNFGNSNNQGKFGTLVQQQATDPVTGDPLVDPITEEPIMVDVFQSGNVNFVDYEEGIYLGYRYWETAGFDKNDGWAWYDENVVFHSATASVTHHSPGKLSELRRSPRPLQPNL
jgi:beta-glucosidase